MHNKLRDVLGNVVRRCATSLSGRNISDCFTGYDTLIVEEACPRVDLLSIKGQHMASHIQVHASTTGVGAIDSVNGKISTVGVFIRGGVHAAKIFFLVERGTFSVSC